MRAMRRRHHAIHHLPAHAVLGLVNPETGSRVEMPAKLRHTNARRKGLSTSAHLEQTLHHSNIIRIIGLAWTHPA